jgi:hypothetical protein
VAGGGGISPPVGQRWIEVVGRNVAWHGRASSRLFPGGALRCWWRARRAGAGRREVAAPGVRGPCWRLAVLLRGAPSSARGRQLRLGLPCGAEWWRRSTEGLGSAWVCRLGQDVVRLGQIQSDLAGPSCRRSFVAGGHGGHLPPSPAIDLQRGAAGAGDVHGYAVAAMAVTCYPTWEAVVAGC